MSICRRAFYPRGRFHQQQIGKSFPVDGVMQASFRWAGDANIAIAIEPAVAGSTLRMVPKVSDLRVRLDCRSSPARMVVSSSSHSLGPACHRCIDVDSGTRTALHAVRHSIKCTAGRPLAVTPHPCLRLSPSLHGWQVSGTFRIVAKPLIQEIPVVAGMIVALKAPPEVSNQLCSASRIQ